MKPPAIQRPTVTHVEPTDRQIVAACREFADILWDEFTRHPGAEPDDLDLGLWKGLRLTLLEHFRRSPSLLASWNEEGPLFSPGVWAARFDLRGMAHRPTWQEVAGVLCKRVGLPAPTPQMTGAEAEARRVVTAPPLPEPPALPPGATDGDYEPTWLERFRRSLSRDSGGPFDRALLMPLMHLSDADANRAIDVMIRERQAHERAKAEQRAQEAEKARVRAVRAAGGDALGRLCRKLHEGQRPQQPAPAPPIDPADDPVIRRGRHHIAEVGQPVGAGGQDR